MIPLHAVRLFALLFVALALAACEDRAPFERACDAGDTKACLVLGEMLAKGRGGVMNKKRAVAVLSRACDAGDAAACALGGGVAYARDDGDSQRLLLEACRLGHVRGCVDAAWMLRHGEGGDADAAKADALLVTACEKGEADGCFFLGLERAARGEDGAAELFAKACSLGDPVACGRGAP
jgi:hypothetical protein